MNVLFVCTGNTCRSAMAEHMFNRMAAKAGAQGATARSCGIAAERYFQVPDEVRNQLAARGITELDHIPQLVGRPILAWADTVLAMADNHLQVLLDLYPEHNKKIHLFLDYAGLGKEDVEDPIGKSEQDYAAAAASIERGVMKILERYAKHP